MATKAFARQYAKRYLKEVSKVIDVEKAILFGSFARGGQHRDSDIDIAIISGDFTDNPMHNRRMLSPLSFKFHRIEFHPFTVKQYREGDPFINEIDSTGVSLPLK